MIYVSATARLPSRRLQQRSGFVAVVIAALFIAIAVVAAVVLERNTVIQQVTRRDMAVAQLQRISNAIIEYGVANKAGTNNLYPCPARVDIAPGNGWDARSCGTNCTASGSGAGWPADVPQGQCARDRSC